MDAALFGSELWTPALDKYTEATGLTVELFDAEGQVVFRPKRLTPLAALLAEHGFDPGLFADCAQRCLKQRGARLAVVADERHDLTVVGTSLVLEGSVVGAAVAGYALSAFANVTLVRHWADVARIPFDRLWSVVRRQPPVPERRLKLHAELLQVLGDALLRENHRTRQYEDVVRKLQAADEAKDEFLAIVSHELRSPLAPIAGWAGVMRNARSLDDVHRAADAIERNAFLQSRMVDDLLDMTRAKQGMVKLDLEVLEVSACLRTALESSAQEATKKSVRVDFSDAEEPLFVEGDTARLQQIFRNILSNAVKFTPAGGSIGVSVRPEGGHAVIAVTDTGKGIAPEFLPHVFELFRQHERGSRRGHDGLGIGLSLVKNLTELHKGTVEISSAGAGRGTQVTLRFPLAAEMPGREAQAAAPSTASLAGLSILVVDDSEDARDALRALLDTRGARVSVAGDGQEALTMLLQGAVPDVVLCDLLMPGLDGFGFIRELDTGPLPTRPPVIAVSALASDASRERTRQTGFDGHIKKPFTETEVLAAITVARARRLAEQVRPDAAPGRI